MTGRPLRPLVVLLGLGVVALLAAGLAGFWHPAAPEPAMLGYLPEVTLATVVVAGLIDAINPCAFTALILVLTALLATLRPGPAAVAAYGARVLGHGGVFVGAVFLTYLAAGAGVLGSLDVLGTGHWPARAAALGAVFLGLWLVRDGLLPDAPGRLRSPAAVTRRTRDLARRATVPGLLAGGVLIGICTLPCGGAVYLGVLALLAAQPTRASGFAYLLLYNLVFITPMVALVAAAASPRLLGRLGRWNLHHASRLRLGLGAGVVLLGLAVLATV